MLGLQTVMQHFILTYLFNHFIHLANYRFFLYPLEMSSRPLMTQDTGQLIWCTLLRNEKLCRLSINMISSMKSTDTVLLHYVRLLNVKSMMRLKRWVRIWESWISGWKDLWGSPLGILHRLTMIQILTIIISNSWEMKYF